MAIEYRIGNLVEAPEGVIAHGCNAQGKFGKGAALAVRNRFPEAFAAYMAAHCGPGLKVGDVIFAECGSHLVANCITQRWYGKDGRLYTDYDAVRACMRKLATDPRVRLRGGIAFPLIGAGLGGGDWTTISQIVERELQGIPAVVYTLDGVVPRPALAKRPSVRLPAPRFGGSLKP
jgi:O-acetyl-ADP-ribose deacetylase (regulator of RNase III)